MACPSSFPCSHEEKHFDPNSSREVDLDKTGCTTSFRGDETDPNFLQAFFWILVPPTDPRLYSRL